MTPIHLSECVSDELYTSMKSSMKKYTFYYFLYHTKHISKHKEHIKDIFKKLNIFLNNFHRRGRGGQASMENSTNSIYSFIRPFPHNFYIGKSNPRLRWGSNLFFLHLRCPNIKQTKIILCFLNITFINFP